MFKAALDPNKPTGPGLTKEEFRAVLDKLAKNDEFADKEEPSWQRYNLMAAGAQRESSMDPIMTQVGEETADTVQITPPTQREWDALKCPIGH